MRVETSTHLPVPPEDAWRTLLRWEEQSEWIRDADSVRVLTDNREGLGVRIAVRNRVFNVPIFTEELEVTGWDPPRRLQMTHMSFIHGTGTWELDPEAEGTHFRWVEDVSLPIPVLGEVALWVYRPFLLHLMRGAMRNLRAFVVPT
ncbi:MAG TPA: SRPBCC family protein [Actinomycetota bacterium]|nr:SRPBCC family protein [Actinomycetota bacterium]